MNKQLKKGMIDALPIFFGYLSVGFAFGIYAIKSGFPIWSPILMSLTHLSGTGQFALVKVANNGGGIFEICFAISVLNIRYILMALSISQRLSPSISLKQRLLIAMADTDEIIAVALKSYGLVTFAYIMGLFLSSYAGWNLGTLLSVLGGALLPQCVINALGIALYAMFVAIIIPDAKRFRPMLYCISTAAILNIAFRFFPTAIRPNQSWSILIAGIVAAVIISAIYPERNQATSEQEDTLPQKEGK
jgi:predicted branched-subunit amino acid permease